MVQRTDARVALALLAAALVLLAGCVGAPSNEEGSLGSPPEDAAASAPREKLALRIAHDQSRGGEHREAFDVPADAGPVDLVLAHHPLGGASAGQCANVDARIEVLDPAGEVAFSFGGVPWAGPTMGACAQQPNPGVVLAPGAWTVVFTGTAPMTGVVLVDER